ncbi:MAG: hypothetical protein IT292_06130 [Deltaproteobacteria bacterium]|nr:hypothetical protein [Deltaproteobacteria bacterium]
MKFSLRSKFISDGFINQNRIIKPSLSMKVNNSPKLKFLLAFVHMTMLIAACSGSASTYSVNKVRVTSAETEEIAEQTQAEAKTTRRNKEEIKNYLNKE